MIVVSNTTAQTLQPGQSITFNAYRKTGCGECFRNNSSTVGLRNNGVYHVSFSANVGGPAAATAVQLAIQIGGSPLLETTMISTPTTADTEFNNVATSTYVPTICGTSNNITVTNTGTSVINIAANPVLAIKREA